MKKAIISKTLLPLALALAGGLGANVPEQKVNTDRSEVSQTTQSNKKQDAQTQTVKISNQYTTSERLPFVGKMKRSFASGQMSRYKQQKQAKKYCQPKKK